MNIDQYRSRLNTLGSEFEEIIKNAPIVQSQDLLGAIAFRIFNEGKATDGTQIGQYAGADSKSRGRYKALRNARGRRIDTVDLQFTGALFESIKTGVSEDRALVGFTIDELAKIGRFNEERYKKAIFKPSESEAENAKELMVDWIKEEMNNKIKSIFSGQ